MQTVMYIGSLVRATDQLGWATQRVNFSERDVVAEIRLSSYSIQEGEQFQPFRPRFAWAYLETEKTPTSYYGGAGMIPAANKLADNWALLQTNYITFQLETQGVTSASAGTVILCNDKIEKPFIDVAKRFELAIYAEDGTVVSTHTEVQLAGGRPIDQDATADTVIAAARARTGRSELEVVPVGTARPSVFRIDPRSKRVEEVDARPGPR